MYKLLSQTTGSGWVVDAGQHAPGCTCGLLVGYTRLVAAAWPSTGGGAGAWFWDRCAHAVLGDMS
jgi:hypothetical protein